MEQPGTPKIAARSHKFLQIQGEILEKNLNYENTDIELSSVPIFTLSNINVGITTVIADCNYSSLEKSNSKKLVNQIDTNKINRIMASPGLLNIIMQEQNELKNVKKVFTGGGAIFLDFLKDLRKKFPNSKIVTLYGSTEAEPIAELDINEITKEDVEKTKNGYGILAGKIIGVQDCKIMKVQKGNIEPLTYNKFEELQTNSVGEIVVCGENVLQGYVNGIGDKENKIKVEDKIYHRTGDLGIIENDRLWLRGRIKEPYFNIESALHAKFNMGKTAVFKYKEKIILVLERSNLVKTEDLISAINFEKIDEIKYVRKIPVDKRHSTKVDYKRLKKILKMED